MKEWEFEEDSEDVDIDRIHKELLGTDMSVYPRRKPLLCSRPNTLEIQAYLRTLERKAPRVFERFTEKYIGKYGGLK